MKIVIAALLVATLVALSAPSAFAAKGVITEVNPSGVSGIIRDLETGDEFRFVSPPNGRPPSIPEIEVDDVVQFDVFHQLAMGITLDTHTGQN